MPHRHPLLSAIASVAVCAALTLIATAPPSAHAQPAPSDAAPKPAPAAVCVEVQVHNVRPQQGQLLLAAYGSAETYSKQALARARAPAGDAITRVQLCGALGDTLAITMFQDLDGDGQMGKNIMGMPTEPWGSSGTPGMFGPNWETGKVKLDGSPIVVRLSQ